MKKTAKEPLILLESKIGTYYTKAQIKKMLKANLKKGWSIFEERRFVEELFNTRFNFFIIIYVVHRRYFSELSVVYENCSDEIEKDRNCTYC